MEPSPHRSKVQCQAEQLQRALRQGDRSAEWTGSLSSNSTAHQSSDFQATNMSRQATGSACCARRTGMYWRLSLRSTAVQKKQRRRMLLMSSQVDDGTFWMDYTHFLMGFQAGSAKVSKVGRCVRPALHIESLDFSYMSSRLHHYIVGRSLHTG